MTRVAIAPFSKPEFDAAVINGGASIAPLDNSVAALVWTDYQSPELLRDTLAANPQLTWVQLPFAGVDAFADIIKLPLRFTSAKGAYSEPVAEHALALSLALGRALPDRVRAKSWGEKFAVSLYESHVMVIGAGGITVELLRLLKPFGCEITVVRESGDLIEGATRTVRFAQLDEHLPEADFVVIAAALTEQTASMFNASRFALMKSSSYLINIARGKHVVTDDLVEALKSGVIAGAALDVTDPEPLPDGHPLWELSNCLITPHTADTPEQVTRMFASRIEKNTQAFVGQGEWVGVVDPVKGY